MFCILISGMPSTGKSTIAFKNRLRKNYSIKFKILLIINENILLNYQLLECEHHLQFHALI